MTNDGTMGDSTPSRGECEVVGTLRWNDFEGGFWSLELDLEHEVLGDHAVLSGFEPPAGAGDGTRVRVVGVPRPDLVDVLMAGPRLEVRAAARTESSPNG